MALIGAILGDIIGSQYEFPKMRPDNLDWEHCELFTDKCKFTDDTVMNIATKWALETKSKFGIGYKIFGNMYPDLSYGNMFKDWIDAKDVLPYNSFGNGSAMRVSPIVDYAKHSMKYLDVGILAMDSALCTHNHPEGIKGAAVVAYVVLWQKLEQAKKKSVIMRK